MPLAGSSSRMTSASDASTRASDTSLDWPKESAPAGTSAKSCMPTNSSHSMALSTVACSQAVLAPRLDEEREHPLADLVLHAERDVLARQLSRWNRRTSWNDRTMPRRAMVSGCEADQLLAVQLDRAPVGLDERR